MRLESGQKNINQLANIKKYVKFATIGAKIMQHRHSVAQQLMRFFCIIPLLSVFCELAQKLHIENIQK